MLVLRRTQGQRITLSHAGVVIGDIVVVEGICRLGFDMPGVEVMRDDAKHKRLAFQAVELPPRGEGYQS